MDHFTLAAVTSMTAAFMALGMGGLYWASPSERCLRDWSLAGFLFFSNCMLSFSLNGRPVGVEPSWALTLTIGVANACTIGGHVVMVSGLRRYLGMRHCLDWALGIGLLTVILHGLPWVRHNVEGRLLTVVPLLTLVNAAAAWCILRAPGYRLRSVLTPLLLVELLYVLQLVVRFVFIAGGSVHGMGLLGSDFIQISGRLALFLYIALASMACALLVIRKQALALRQHAETDPMTGWFNRWSLAKVLSAEFDRNRRTGSGFHLVTFDIDHFKRINDRCGHAVGDQAIQHVTSLVALELRGYDQKFRIGGEEFVICVPGQPGDLAAQVAERLRQRIEATPLATDTGPIAITVSVGHAGTRADDPGWESVLKRADLALYEAKQSGRNRVIAAPLQLQGARV